MDSLIGNFQNVIQTLFTEFSNRITQEHENITVADLEAIWAKIPDNFNIKLICDKKSDIFNKCKYVYAKGLKSGEICNCKTKNDEYCSRHINKTKPIKSKAIYPNEKDFGPKKIVISMNKKIGKYCHKETRLVFKSQDERIVIGHLKNGIINDLDEPHIEICKKWGFRIMSI